MSWKPSDAVRAKDRERKRKAYEPKTDRGELSKKARVFADAFKAWASTPHPMPDEATLEAAWNLVEHFEVKP